MYTCCAVVYSCQHIAGGKVVVVVGMEVEAQGRVALRHLFEVSSRKDWIQYAQGVGQHETLYTFVFEGVDKLKHILWRVFHAV